MASRARYVTRILFVAVVLLLAVGWAIWNRPAAVVATVAEEGRVLSAQERFGVVQIADGRKVRLFFPAPPPRPGESVTLRVERRADGKAIYRVDAGAWRSAHAH